ncbi:hypothetical protein HNO88_000252 [Novosphingobium chloroacetimidivorans]|uniref:Uncharacterized protein n=1 Tax=Novosphingobium chloroacetimidivorans TaxID=1428314 RepID=A0A7W7NVB4_9SPHN|nr:hypothetical protein [Novosphingobium chloroacetimidivorans]MBB4856955.1 hypothetical protein [Novosphingobium chloroacetimidivorans]
MIDKVQHAGAGLSFLFEAGQRPDAAVLRSALTSCQAQAQITREEPGALEIVANGLAFECQGLAPCEANPVGSPSATYGFSPEPSFDGLEAVQLHPGAHLSGGLTLAPVTRALLALSAELAVALPVRAVVWHPADAAIEPQRFSRSVLAWLAGGAFPALGLTALTQLGEGIVVSRGLRHFAGQEVTVRAGAESLAVAAGAVDRIVRQGAPSSITEWVLDGRPFRAEPSRHAGQILVWPAD